jgi:CheY-like chemotaxis protein
MSEIPQPESALVLSEAILAVRIGEKDLAKKLLRTILAAQPRHEQALLWSAALATSRTEAVELLERCLGVNPNNQQAANTLSMLRLDREVKEPATVMARGRLWVCPLCDAQDLGEPARCRNCGGVYRVDDMDALRDNRDRKERLLLAAVQKWEHHQRAVRTYEGQLNLARAYLNLHRSHEAIPYLRAASDLNPQDHAVRRALDRLMRRKLVLAVDDSSTIRRIVASLVEKFGYRALTASDGQEALNKMQTERPDLVLLDVMMPGLNGYQVCREIRRSRDEHVPVVILSSSILDRIKGRLAGVTDYMAKPFEAESLEQMLAKYAPKALAASQSL